MNKSVCQYCDPAIPGNTLPSRARDPECGGDHSIPTAQEHAAMENSGQCASDCPDCFHYDADPCDKHAYKRPETDLMLVYLLAGICAVVSLHYWCM
jgi:hypothetical protein